MTDFKKLYDGSWYTIVGCGGDIQEWKDGYQGLLNERGIGTIKEWAEFTGKEMNEFYGLTGKNRYKSSIHFLAFSLEGLEVPKLSLFKLGMGDRWFDDIVDNNRAREETA